MDAVTLGTCVSAMDLNLELRRAYGRVCADLDRLLAENRLTEARRLNDEARTLYRRLYQGSRITPVTPR